MEHVVSAEQARAEGDTAEQLALVADWHDGLAVQADRGNKSRRPNPERAVRHRRIAKALRRIAGELNPGDGVPA